MEILTPKYIYKKKQGTEKNNYSKNSPASNLNSDIASPRYLAGDRRVIVKISCTAIVQN